MLRRDSTAEAHLAVSTPAAPTRRGFLSGAAASAGITLLHGIAAPYLSRAADRPRITHGLQSGDVSTDSGIVWARADRPARMLVEVATTDSFRHVRSAVAVDALPESDFTAKALIETLPPGQDIFYRIRFQDLASPTVLGEPLVGRFRTAPATRRSVSFVWSGDTAGQGFGIDEARGGMLTYATMRQERPDFFVHCGDSIYADCPIPGELKLPDGGIWRNVVTAEKSKVAETLAEYRGNYKYNLLDQSLRAFNAEVPTFAQWDDHEVVDDWWPGQPVRRDGYAERSMLALAARGGRAFHEFTPTRQTWAEPGRIYRRIAYGPLLDVFMLDPRSYRSPNGAPDETGHDAFLGPVQLAWLKQSLRDSAATWKAIVIDLPLGVVSHDGIALGDGPPRGREREIADLLSFIRRARIRNTVWLAADVHYTAAHWYDPNRAVLQAFDPFWEFVSGPLHAGTFAPGTLDNTFGPQLRFAKGCAPGQPESLAPCFGLQFFGHVAIDGTTAVMTVTLKDVAGTTLWSTAIEPAPNDEAATVAI
jgi:alkaline phosphatase D